MIEHKTHWYSSEPGGIFAALACIHSLLKYCEHDSTTHMSWKDSPSTPTATVRRRALIIVVLRSLHIMRI